MGAAVEAGDGDAAGDVAEDGVEDGGDGGVVAEVGGSDASDLGQDNEGDGLGVVVGLHAEFLGNSVVGEEEVVGGEFEDDFAMFGFDEGGDEDEVGADGECSGFRSCGGVRSGLRLGVDVREGEEDYGCGLDGFGHGAWMQYID